MHACHGLLDLGTAGVSGPPPASRLAGLGDGLRPASRLASLRRFAGLRDGVGLRPSLGPEAGKRTSCGLLGLGDGRGLRTSARPRGWQAGLPDLGTALVSGPPPGPEAGKPRTLCWTWDGVGLRTFARPRGWQGSHALLDLGTAWVSRPSPGPEAGKAHTLCWTWGRRGSPDLRPAPRLARLVLILTLTCSRHFTTFTFRVQVQGLPYLNPCPSLPPSLPLPTATGC